MRKKTIHVLFIFLHYICFSFGEALKDIFKKKLLVQPTSPLYGEWGGEIHGNHPPQHPIAASGAPQARLPGGLRERREDEFVEVLAETMIMMMMKK